MFHNSNPQDGQLFAYFQGATIALSAALSALVEVNRTLLEENAAKDHTIKSFEEKVFQQQQEIDDLRREHDWQQNYWDNDGSSNADCHDREYAAQRLGSW